MMNYYRWELFAECIAETQTEYPFVGYPVVKIQGWDEYLLQDGVRIDNWPEDVYMETDYRGEFWDNVMQVIELKVVSNRLKEFIESECPGHAIQWLPVKIVRAKGGPPITDQYWIMNLLERRATWHRAPGAISVSPTREFIHQPGGDIKIFHEENDPVFIIVRQDLKEAMERRGFTGLGFLRRQNLGESDEEWERSLILEGRARRKLLKAARKLPDHLAEALAIAASGANLTIGANRLLQSARKALPDGPWKRLESFDFAGEYDGLRRWLERTLNTEPPSKAIKAFWFGLFDAGDDTGSRTRLYICGSKTFTVAASKEGDFDWAADTEWWPEGRYAPSGFLRLVYELANEGEATQDAARRLTFDLTIGYAALVAANLCRDVTPSLLLTGRAKRHAAVGFDEGDGLLLGVVEPGGFKAG